MFTHRRITVCLVRPTWDQIWLLNWSFFTQRRNETIKVTKTKETCWSKHIMPWIFISFCDNSRGFLSLSHVCECVWWKGLQKQKGNKKKNHESTGPLEWALGLWYRQRKTTRSLVQYQTLHRREWFFLFYWFFLKVFFLFSQMKAPDNLWFMAFQPSGVFKSRENCFISFFFLLSIDTCSLLYRSWNDNKCQLLHFFFKITPL